MMNIKSLCLTIWSNVGQDTLGMFGRRVMDVAGCNPKLNVKLNKKPLKVRARLTTV
jgi:hypothetical protein